MITSRQQWLDNPTVVQAVEAIIGLIVIYAAIKLACRLFSHKFEEPVADATSANS